MVPEQETAGLTEPVCESLTVRGINHAATSHCVGEEEEGGGRGGVQEEVGGSVSDCEQHHHQHSARHTTACHKPPHPPLTPELRPQQVRG